MTRPFLRFASACAGDFTLTALGQVTLMRSDDPRRAVTDPSTSADVAAGIPGDAPGLHVSRNAGDQGVSALVREVPVLESTITCSAVADLFNRDGTIPAVIVRLADGHYGLADRVSYLPQYLDGFHRDLFARKPITTLMDQNPVVVPWDMPVERVGMLLSADKANAIRSSFIITRDGASIGVGMAIDLMRLVAREAQERLLQLTQTQAHLVQAQTFASMGRLVAGVAHEINTPVGVSLTAATHLRARVSELVELFDENRLRRSDFSNFGTNAQEATSIIVENINRAASLITSFKNVAVDQATAERRAFNLKGLLEDTLHSLSPTVRKTRVRTSVICADDLVMESYPGPLSQVITNLTINAVTHGFSTDDEGEINVSATVEGDIVHVTFADDGRGIELEHLARIFEPFFTTRRAYGGTGLGLHIVHNLVTQLLGGSIECRSVPGTGAVFRIALPLNYEISPAGAGATPFGAPIAPPEPQPAG